MAKAVGPPLLAGGKMVDSGTVAAASGLGRSAIHGAGVIADATMTHIVPAVQALATHYEHGYDNGCTRF